MQAMALLTLCLKDELVASNDERGVLLLQLGKHLQDLGQTSRAVQVGCRRLTGRQTNLMRGRVAGGGFLRRKS